MTANGTSASSPRSPMVGPSSMLANQSQQMPTPECCCFSARFVNLVLFIFHFIFLLSGISILLLTLLYGRPEVSRYLGETTKYLSNIISLLGSGHLVQIIHYTMLFCGVVIIVISLVNITASVLTSWSHSSDYYYYHRRRKLKENEALLYHSSTLDSTSPRSSYLNSSNNSHDLSARSSPQKPKTPSIWARYSNSSCALCFYIFLLLFLFTVQLVIGLLSVVSVSPEHVFISSQSEANDDFLVSVRESVDRRSLLIDRAADIEQLFAPFHCCGWYYFDDYEYLDNPERRNRSAAVPDACCKTWVTDCGQSKHPNNIYYEGCWSKFGAEMRDYVLMLGWIALGFSVVELFGLMFAVCHYVQMVSKPQ